MWPSKWFIKEYNETSNGILRVQSVLIRYWFHLRDDHLVKRRLFYWNREISNARTGFYIYLFLSLLMPSIWVAFDIHPVSFTLTISHVLWSRFFFIFRHLTTTRHTPHYFHTQHSSSTRFNLRLRYYGHGAFWHNRLGAA